MIRFSRREQVPKLMFGNALPIDHETLRNYERPASVRIVSAGKVAAQASAKVEPLEPEVREITDTPIMESLADYYVPYEPQSSRDKNEQLIVLTAKSYAQDRPEHPNDVGLRIA